jgi:hypothetical protein
MSSSKGVISTSAHMVVQRDLRDLDAPVARYCAKTCGSKQEGGYGSLAALACSGHSSLSGGERNPGSRRIKGMGSVRRLATANAIVEGGT